MSNTLTNLYAELHAIKKAVAEENNRHTKVIDRLSGEMNAVCELINQGEADLDSDKIKLGMYVLEIGGSLETAGGESSTVVEDAIKYIATGDAARYRAPLWKERYGVKNYAQWRGQRSDHTYGYGPSHGYITFSVGFTFHMRQRGPSALDAEYQEAALYVLHNLRAIQAAKAAAKLTTTQPDNATDTPEVLRGTTEGA